jgi:hypothetical protein
MSECPRCAEQAEKLEWLRELREQLQREQDAAIADRDDLRAQLAERYTREEAESLVEQGYYEGYDAGRIDPNLSPAAYCYRAQATAERKLRALAERKLRALAEERKR